MLKVKNTIFDTTEDNDVAVLIRSIAKSGGNLQFGQDDYVWVAPGIESTVAASIYEVVAGRSLQNDAIISYSSGDFIVTATAKKVLEKADAFAKSLYSEDESNLAKAEIMQKLESISVALSALSVLVINA